MLRLRLLLLLPFPHDQMFEIDIIVRNDDDQSCFVIKLIEFIDAQIIHVAEPSILLVKLLKFVFVHWMAFIFFFKRTRAFTHRSK